MSDGHVVHVVQSLATGGLENGVVNLVNASDGRRRHAIVCLYEEGALRAIRANIRYHLSYVNHLAHERRWLAGDEMSFADMAAAGHVSVLDYLGEIAWESFPAAKSWYARMKSRPSFRELLTDRMPGVAPARIYADLDF